jgi:hypothetical protein
MKRISKILTFLMMIIIVSSCAKYPDEIDRLLEDLVVITQYDVTADFGEYSTFMISDSLGVITDKDTSFVYNSTSQLVIDQIVTNMVDRGYQRVNAGGDIALQAAYFENVNVAVYYPGWYWGYPGYYPPGYWGYPGYGYGYGYYPAYYTTYTSGTLIIEMLDLKNAEAEEKIFIRWDALIRGLLTGNHSSSQVTASIDQAFTQTPQLKK